MRIQHFAPSLMNEGKNIYVELKQFRLKVLGIRADIKVHSCTGKPEGRIETNFGFKNRIGTDYNVITAQHSVRPHQDVIAGLTFIDRYKANGDHVSYTADESWNGKYDVGQLANKSKRISVKVNRQNKKTVYWWVNGANQSVRHLPKAVGNLPLSLRRNYISTKRREDIGDSMETCIIDVDNVYVYR